MKSEDGSLGHRRWTSDDVERHLHALPEAELLALVLGGGCVQEKSVRLARELLAGMGGLFGLPGASVAMLRHGGLRDAQASALLASREIASRLALQSIPKRRPLDPQGRSLGTCCCATSCRSKRTEDGRTRGQQTW
jgi:DNA repair protein RadC